MCGIAGIFNAAASFELRPALSRMTDAMVHRGPDGCGISLAGELNAGLACRRLSLVDLVNGGQPIANETGNVSVVLNGEIYNYRELRAELEALGHQFRTRSDTEVIVHLYEEEGTECFIRLNGMFAIAILDEPAGRLILARDPSGMKPLYWTSTPAGLVFASEVKALAASGLISLNPDRVGLDAFLTAGFVPAPRTCFQGIERLSAGEFLAVGRAGIVRQAFWRLRFYPSSKPKDDREYAAELDYLLRAAVRAHLAADVPVGAYISGGWDSSLVATFAAEQSSRTLKTFSLIFPDDPDMDESRFSRSLAQRLKTEHYEIETRASDIPDLLPKAIRALEEPCTAGPALLEFHLASEAAREVKAVLSGEGSDELFGGYVWLRSNTYYKLRSVVPRSIARMAARVTSDPRCVRAFGVLGAEDEVDADLEWFRALTSSHKDSLINTDWRSSEPETAVFRQHADTLLSCTDRLQRRLSLDFSRRLAEGILFINDKMSMAHSLETRMPFLDRRLLDFASALPSTMKIRNGQEKFVISLLASRLPAAIAGRRKFGLGYPSRVLLGEPVRSFIEQVLLDSTAPDGPFRRKAVENVLRRVRTGPPESTRLVWMLLTVQCWWNEFFGCNRASCIHAAAPLGAHSKLHRPA